MSSAALALAKKLAQNKAKAVALHAQNQAKRYAASKARQVANSAKRHVNSGISSVVQKHLGNNAQSRALANKLKAHVSNKINKVHTQTQNQIKTTSGFKLF
jgi:hypothetical protein